LCKRDFSSRMPDLVWIVGSAITFCRCPMLASLPRP
jgi:hypothetical protein